jgi:hypothetical protein
MLADFMIFYPRAAYYVLREAHNVNPLLKELLEYVDNVFSNISLIDAVWGQGDKAALGGGGEVRKISFSTKSRVYNI